MKIQTLSKAILCTALLLVGCQGPASPGEMTRSKEQILWLQAKAKRESTRVRPRSYGVWLSSIPARGH